MAHAAAGQAQTTTPPPAKGEGAIVAPTVRVTAPRVVTPLPGIVLERDQMSTNVQSATGKEIEASRSISVTDFMNSNMQSVNVNDYRGNPYQQDLNYRGFTASPSIGTPQGLSVYLDGVRINEPFGEVVNWDLIPLAAIRRMEIMPGANPLFGLNTLGGALSITTKSGFTDPGGEIKLQMGSFGRRQAQVGIGGNNGVVGGFVAFNGFDEEGWRKNSPSSVRQAFGKGTIRLGDGEVNLSVLAADNSLVGNGVVPVELYRQDRTAVFSSPDQVDNRLLHITLSGMWNLTERFSASAMMYRRDLKQDSVGGDFWDEWPAAASSARVAPCTDRSRSTYADGSGEVDAPGCPNTVPNGVFNFGRSNQLGKGVSSQLNVLGDTYQIVLGTSHDSNELEFAQRQRLGWVGNDRNVYLDPADVNGTGLAALSRDILRNNLVGGGETTSLYTLGVWNIDPTLTITAGARYNHSRVRNSLISDRPIPLYQFTDRVLNRLQPRCGAENDVNSRFFCSSGDYGYLSFNPSLGVSLRPNPELNFYGNWSRGTRVPSAIELGCARDRQAEDEFSNQNAGKLQGCSIPTALANDPFLPQVRATNYELGMRGQTADLGLLWNASAFRTDLSDDILFVSLGKKNRGVFDTFGKTRRQGIELGLSGSLGRHTFRVNYTRIEATVQSSARLVNLSNSESTKVQGQVNEFEVRAGDYITGMPKDILRLAWNMDVTDRWNIGFTVLAHSSSYARGNENNDHQAGGTDSDGSPVTARYDPSITVEPGRAYVGSGKVGGYGILNFNTTFQFRKSLAFFLRIDNLFDRDYATASELGLNPFVAGRWGQRDAAGFNYNSYDWQHTNFIGPGTPRALWVGLTYSFQPFGGSPN